MTQPHDTVDPQTIDLYQPKSENAFRKDVVEAARSRGWLVYYHDTNAPTFHVVNGRRSRVRSMGTPGFPDLTMVREGRLIFAELKIGKNKPTENQHIWLSELGEVGLYIPYSVGVYVWYPSQWNEAMEILE